MVLDTSPLAKIEMDTNHINKLIKGLREIKDQHPECKLGYRTEPGSILNAYREGDISFEQAVSAIEEYAKTKTKEKIWISK